MNPHSQRGPVGAVALEGRSQRIGIVFVVVPSLQVYVCKAFVCGLKFPSVFLSRLMLLHANG